MTAVDLFAGLGGWTEGARQAGVDVLWAANHWQAAVHYHQLNHPHVQHECQDLHQVDWTGVPAHNLCLASPSCQGHARARGKERKHHDACRSTAWAVVSCLEVHRPAFAVVENVPEFMDWELYPAWVSALVALGYRCAAHVIDAADAGVPQNRLRYFGVLSRSKHPMCLQRLHQPHVPVRQIIQWNAWPWSKVRKRGRSLETLERVRRGRREFGYTFVMPYYGSGSGLTGRSLDRPLGTVTTRDRWAIVVGDKMRMFQVPEYLAAMGFPDDYQVPLTPRHLGIHLLGNAVPPLLAKAVIRQIRAAA